LWRSAGRFDPERGNEPGFVAAVARNAAIDMSRRRATRTSIPLAEPEELVPPVPSPTEGVVTSVTVRGALATLPPAQRDLLRLACSCPPSEPETAGRLGIPVGRVRSRTFRARGVLRAVLRDDAGK